MAREGEIKLDEVPNTVKYAHTSSVSAGEVLNVKGIGAIVALTAASANVEVEYQVRGLVQLPITSAVTVTQGLKCYWDVSENKILLTGMATEDFYLGIAHAAGTAAGGYVKVDLNKNVLMVGTSADPVSVVYSTHGLEVYTTSASTDGSNTVQPSLFEATMTGAAGVGRALRATLNVTNVALGGWSNAIKGLIDFKTSGSVAGLGSAICAEMVMCGGAMAALGTYGVLELEMVCPASWSGTNAVSFIHAAASGSTVANFRTIGHLMNLTGLGSATAGNMFDTCVAAPASHSLRILIDGVPYYIMLTNNVDDT